MDLSNYGRPDAYTREFANFLEFGSDVELGKLQAKQDVQQTREERLKRKLEVKGWSTGVPGNRFRYEQKPSHKFHRKDQWNHPKVAHHEHLIDAEPVATQYGREWKDEEKDKFLGDTKQYH